MVGSQSQMAVEWLVGADKGNHWAHRNLAHVAEGVGARQVREHQEGDVVALVQNLEPATDRLRLGTWKVWDILGQYDIIVAPNLLHCVGLKRLVLTLHRLV